MRYVSADPKNEVVFRRSPVVVHDRDLLLLEAETQIHRAVLDGLVTVEEASIYRANVRSYRLLDKIASTVDEFSDHCNVVETFRTSVTKAKVWNLIDNDEKKALLDELEGIKREPDLVRNLQLRFKRRIDRMLDAEHAGIDAKRL